MRVEPSIDSSTVNQEVRGRSERVVARISSVLRSLHLVILPVLRAAGGGGGCSPGVVIVSPGHVSV